MSMSGRGDPDEAAAPLWPATTPQGLHTIDAAALQEDFEREQDELFVNETETEIRIIEFIDRVKTDILLSGDEEIKQYCLEGRKENHIRIILIPQSTSWSEMEICRTAFQSLLTTFNISPGFWNVVKLFGFKRNSNHESGGGFNEQIWDEGAANVGFSYCVKHVEEHGRSGRYSPWSTRQIGVHHETNLRTNENTFVILNPSKELLGRLERMIPDATPIDVHTAVLSAATSQWTRYIEYLEAQGEELSRKATLSSTNPKSTGATTSLAFKVQHHDTQMIQHLQDTILRASHMLDLNQSIFDAMLGPEAALQAAATKPIPRAKRSLLASLSAQTRIRKLRMEDLLRRLNGTSSLIRSILDAQALEALQASSRLTAELAGLARQDAEIGTVLARKATRDGRTLKTITILTLVYLPASFVATLLGTQYIQINSSDGGLGIEVAREMWVFGVLTIILLIATLGVWLFWEWRHRVVHEVSSIMDEKMTI